MRQCTECLGEGKGISYVADQEEQWVCLACEGTGEMPPLNYPVGAVVKLADGNLYSIVEVEGDPLFELKYRLEAEESDKSLWVSEEEIVEQL